MPGDVDPTPLEIDPHHRTTREGHGNMGERSLATRWNHDKKRGGTGRRQLRSGGARTAPARGDRNRQCLCSFSGMPDMVEHFQPPFASVLFRPLPTRTVSPRRLTLRKILEVIRLLLVC